MHALPLVGGIEAGGTKCVCAVGTAPDDIRAEVRFPTTNPAETLAHAITFFQAQQARYGQLVAIGVAAFGPADPHPASPTYGYITTTPKPGWQHTNVVGPLGSALGVPIAFDTDVNGAALGEHRWGGRPRCGHLHLPHDWHGRRRRRDGQWELAARLGAS